MPMRITPDTVGNDMKQALIDAEGYQYSSLALCRVEAVDVVTKTVVVSTFNPQQIYKNVSYMMPYYNKGTGIIFVPSKDSMGILCFDSHNVPFLLGSIAPFTAEHQNITHSSPKFGDYNFPDLKEGDILVSSGGRGCIFLDNNGNITISSSLMASSTYTDEGDIAVMCENKSEAINGTSTEEYTEDFKDTIKVTTGEHSLQCSNCEDDVIQLNYSVQDKRTGSFIGFDKDGNIHITGNVITHKR